MIFNYKPVGVCSSSINLDIDDNNIINKVEIVGGCPGNTKGVCILCKGQTVDDVIKKLEGIPCGNRGTSCPDQLAEALKIYKSRRS